MLLVGEHFFDTEIRDPGKFSFSGERSSTRPLIQLYEPRNVCYRKGEEKKKKSRRRRTRRGSLVRRARASPSRNESEPRGFEVIQFIKIYEENELSDNPVSKFCNRYLQGSPPVTG